MRKRNYRREYDRDHSSPAKIAQRSNRNKARRKVVKSRGAKAVQGKDIHHKDHNPNNNSMSNLSIASVAKNRSDNGKSKKRRQYRSA
jgi:hypothetical protein